MNTLDLKKLFYLDSNITYLNHGSFGACPIEVMDKYFKLQIELEKQPIDFLANNINETKYIFSTNKLISFRYIQHFSLVLYIFF